VTRETKTTHSAKQKRQAKHIEDSEEKAGKSKAEATRIAWSTVNRPMARTSRQNMH